MPQATYPNPVRAARYDFAVNGFLFGLAPGGVFPATTVTNRAVRSYRTISPLPAMNKGGIFSVALSVDSRLPGVTWHLALWSPDFPPFVKTKSDCLTDSVAIVAECLAKDQRVLIINQNVDVISINTELEITCTNKLIIKVAF